MLITLKKHSIAPSLLIMVVPVGVESVGSGERSHGETAPTLFSLHDFKPLKYGRDAREIAKSYARQKG